MKIIAAITLGLSVFLGSTHASFDHTHSHWSEVLNEYVSENGKQTLVDYKSLKRNPSGLNAYLNELSMVSANEFRKFTKDQRLAFLINSYNAFTLKLIINNYPLKSIRDIGNFISGPWDKEFISLLGRKVDLDHIEHTLIRKNFSEPRIHFAVNCASIGCPNLSLKAYRATDLDQHLESMARSFMEDTKKNNYDTKRRKLNLSKIFKWYGSDFDEHYPGGLNAFLAKFLGKHSQEKNTIERGRVSKKYLTYDWSLNDNK